MYQSPINKNANNSYYFFMIVFLLNLFITAISLANETATPSFSQLIDNLNNLDTEVHWNAINSLAELGDPRAVPILIAELKKDLSERKGYSMAIIPALGQLNDERAIPILTLSLNKRDDHWLGRSSAALALGDLKAKQAVPDLIQAAWMSDTRNAAIIALANISDPETIDILISSFYPGEEAETKTAAIKSLVSMGKTIVPQLIKKLDIDNPEQAIATIEERAGIISVLGLIGDHRAIDAITKSMTDPSPIVRQSAKKALQVLTKANNKQRLLSE